ncbi:MAG TPA: alpha/beta hydrolase [Bordetella sp.]
MTAADTAASGIAWADIHTPTRDLLRLEYRWIAPERRDAPLLVFLHEGLGSIAIWRDWPEQVCAAAGCRGLVYSRYGYGQSTPRPAEEKLTPRYLHEQAHEVLPALLAALGVDAEADKPVFYGHSDGGSIALLYAARYPQAVAGIAIAAPHIFVEDITVEGIRQARELYLTTDLRGRLARYHADVDSAFWGWNDAWLDPVFRDWNIEREVRDIRCPILAMQGIGDHYGTLEQIRGIARLAPQTRLLEIPACGHTPHKDQPKIVTRALVDFLRSLPR